MKAVSEKSEVTIPEKCLQQQIIMTLPANKMKIQLVVVLLMNFGLQNILHVLLHFTLQLQCRLKYK